MRWRLEEDSIYDWLKFKRFIFFVLVSVAVIAAVAYILKSLLIAVAISLIFTYLLSPAVSLVDRFVLARRHWIVLCIVIVFFGIFASIAAAVLPTIYRELVEIVKQIPQALLYLNQVINPLRDWLIDRNLVSSGVLEQVVMDLDLTGKLSSTTTQALQQVWLSTPKVLGGALNTFLIPVLTWFFLNYFRTIKSFIRKLMPPDVLEMAAANVRHMDLILWGVVKGQLLVALILSFLYMAGFSILGLQSGVAIGAVAGLCRVVPYFDVLVGISLSLVVLIGQGSSLALLMGVVIVVITVQVIDGMLITPRIIGERAGIHPVIVIVSVITSGDWFGILGVLLAVPIVAVLVSSLQMALPYYYQSPFYKGKSIS